ncbi:MAG: RHS domain-containing protein [Candidatus Tectomicrobia bacterium]|uniref:RHS domain-containing protein n=1 Tax=Tectimicrobiota bacterium TaxID=2528274 RepID=A0A932GPP9_UNCTE|nr:RHS domain-containing protein [Candidatus Tectomicrobia bacterium]
MKSPRLGSLSLFLPFVCMALTLLPLKSSEAALSLLELGSILAQTIIGQAAPSEVLLYVHTDHLGTPVMMTDEQGQTVWEVDMEPFGETTITAQPGVTLNLRFPGQYFDEETGLDYNYFRDYDPSTGRYVEPDPIGIQQGANPLYSYVDNNPMNWIDLLGLYTQEELANIIYNETGSLSGKGIYDARVVIGYIAENRYIPGKIDRGIAPPQLSAEAETALRNKVPSIVAAYSQAKQAAATALCSKDTTGGAKGFVIKGNPSRPARYGLYPVLQQFGPFNNSYPTAGNPRVPVGQQLPASGVYINIFAQ